MKEKKIKKKTAGRILLTLSDSGEYTGDYLGPEQVFALRRLIHLGRISRAGKPKVFFFPELLTFLGHEIMESFQISGTIVETVCYEVTKLLDSLQTEGILETVQPFRAPGISSLGEPSDDSANRWCILEEAVKADAVTARANEWSTGDDRLKIMIVFGRDSVGSLNRVLDAYMECFMKNHLYALALQHRVRPPEFYSYENNLQFLQFVFSEKYRSRGSCAFAIDAKLLLRARMEWEREEKPFIEGSVDEEQRYERWMEEPQIRPLETLFCMEKERKIDIFEMAPDHLSIVVRDKSLFLPCPGSDRNNGILPAKGSPVIPDSSGSISPHSLKDGGVSISIDGNEIEIGKAWTQKCKLLQCLHPFGEIERNVESIFCVMISEKRIQKFNSPKDVSFSKQVELITGTVKEINRILKPSGVRERIHARFTQNGHNMKLILS